MRHGGPTRFNASLGPADAASLGPGLAVSAVDDTRDDLVIERLGYPRRTCVWCPPAGAGDILFGSENACICEAGARFAAIEYLNPEAYAPSDALVDEELEAYYAARRN